MKQSPLSPPRAGAAWSVEDPENAKDLRAVGTGSRSRQAVGAVAIWFIAVGMIYTLPPVGALLSVAVFVAVVPLGGERLSARLVSTCVVGAGLLGLLLALGDTFGFRVLTLGRLQSAFLVPATAAVLVLLYGVVRQQRIHAARLDAATVPLLLATGVGWWSAGYPAQGVEFGDTIGGLMLLGWDHQSHFTIFSYMQEQRGVWRQGPPESASLFLDYPPLAGAIAVGLTTLVGAPTSDASSLLENYVRSASAMFGLAVGLIAWTAAKTGEQVATRRLRRVHPGGVAVFCGLAVGGYVVLGPASAFFDYGFTNFLLAISMATATSWLVIAELKDYPGRAAVVVMSATAAMGLLWTPLVLLMAPSGLVLLVRIIRGKLWGLLVMTVLLAAVGAWVAAWQVYRIVPDGSAANSIAQTLAAVGGGQPAVPVSHLVLLVLLGVATTVTRARLGNEWWAPLALPLAGVLIAIAFAVNTTRAGFPVADSYYVAKALWIVYLALLPLLGTLTAVCIVALVGSTTSREKEAFVEGGRGSLRTLLVGLAVASVLWFSTLTENAPNGYIDYYSIPVGGQAVLDRWDAFRNVPQGEVVAAAYEETQIRPHRTVVVWDSGDLLTNRWLASLRGDLTADADAIYTALPSPYAEPARTALEQALQARPQLKLLIVASRPSRDFLRPLQEMFPGRVAFIRT